MLIQYETNPYNYNILPPIIYCPHTSTQQEVSCLTQKTLINKVEMLIHLKQNLKLLRNIVIRKLNLQQRRNEGNSRTLHPQLPEPNIIMLGDNVAKRSRTFLYYEKTCLYQTFLLEYPLGNEIG